MRAFNGAMPSSMYSSQRRAFLHTFSPWRWWHQGPAKHQSYYSSTWCHNPEDLDMNVVVNPLSW